MSAYIARSALATFLLELAQSREPAIAGLYLDFTSTSSTGGNWHVSRIDRGEAGDRAAHAAVAWAVRGNSAWVMVEDGDPRDGEQIASTEDVGPRLRLT